MQLALTVLTFSAAWRVWTTDEFSKRKERAPAVAATEAPKGEEPVTSFVRAVAAAGAAPESLRATAVDGDLTVDARGHFVPTPDARRLFDYFLAATGEEPEVTLRARIVAEIERRLMLPASAEAIALLDAYLAYRGAVRQLAAQPEVHEDLEMRLTRLRKLQRDTLGNQAAEAFFSDDDTDVERVLARRRIIADERLSADERARKLAELEAERPATAASTLSRDVQALRKAGGDDEAVYALRAERFGAEAASRLAALDQRRSEWAERLTTYRAERARLLEGAQLDPDERRAALDELRQTYFSPLETQRVATLDRMAGLDE